MKRLLLVVGLAILFTVPITAQNSDNIDFVGTIDTYYSNPVMDLANDIIYFGQNSLLHIYDVTDPASPAALGPVMNIGSTINDLEYHTFSQYRRLYLACDDGFHIIDVTNPGSPYEVGFLAATYGFDKLALRSYTEAWLIGDYPNIKIINFYPDPTSPTVVATANFDGYPWDVFVDQNNYVYIAGSWGGLKIFDWTTEIHSIPYNAFGVHVAGDYAYVTDNDSSLYILDVSALPAAPVEVGHYYTTAWPLAWPTAFGVYIDGDDAYVAAGQSGLRWVDVSDPTTPMQIGYYDWTGGAAWDVQFHNGYIYVTTNSTGIGIYHETPPELAVSPSPVDFGYVRVDERDTTQVTVSNNGGGELTITSASITGTYASYFGINFSADITLGAGESSDINVSFAPEWERSYNVVLTIVSDVGTVIDTIIGNGAYPRITVSPSTVNFGDVILGNTETREVTVENSGNVLLVVGPIAISGTDTMEFNADTTSFVLAAGNNQNLSVSYTPVDYGNSSATLEITSDIEDIGYGTSKSIDLVGNSLSGQPPLAGSYTIGLSGSYETFTAAVNDLAARGISSPVIFNVLAGTYEEQIEFGIITGASAANTITFQSLSGNAKDVTLQYAPYYLSNYVVALIGADYITIQNMTLTTLSTSSYSRVVYIDGNAHDNLFVNNIFYGGTSSSGNNQNGAVIACNYNSQLDNTTIRGNVFNGGGTGVHFETSSDGSCDNTLIEDNTFNCNGSGVVVDGYYSSWNPSLGYGTRILNNTFNSENDPRSGFSVSDQSAPIVSGNTVYLNDDDVNYHQGISVGFRDGATVNNNIVSGGIGSYGIWIGGSGVPLTIKNNKIDGTLRYDGNGIIVRYYGTAGNQGLIANNFVKVVGGSAGWQEYTSAGIHLLNSDSLDIINNTVVSAGAAPAFRAYYDSDYVGGGLNVIDNIFTNTGGGLAVDYIKDDWGTYDPLPASNSDYNDLYTTGTILASIQSNDYTDLAALQSHYWSIDQNSVSVYPHFIAADDLHVTSPYLDGAGTPWTGVTADIDGETRHTTNPDIGADEFTPDVSSVPLSGDYTIGSGSDYSTFTTATQDLNLRGISGPVTFNIADGIYNEQIKLFDIPGASVSDTIIFQTQSGNAADVTLQYSATHQDSNYVVRLYNADHFRFRNLTLSADTTSGAPFGRVFSFYNSSDIIIQDNVLIGSPVTENDDNHALIFGSHYNDLIIKENSFSNGDYGINVSGSSSSGTQVTNNTFNGYNGMSLSGQSNPIIANNTINKGGISSSGASVITDNILTNGGISGGASVITGNNLNHGGVAVSGVPVIEDNIINSGGTGISVDCSGPPQVQKNRIQAVGKGMYITGQGMSSNNRGLIANNMVNVGYSGDNTRGFEVNDGSSGGYDQIYLDLYNNTVNVAYSSNQQDNSRTGNSSSVVYLDYTGYMGSPGNVNVINNIFTNLTGGYVYDMDYNSWFPYNSAWHHNDLYTTGLTVAKKLGDDYADLASWQTATNQDSNSVSVFPGYLSDTDLHVNSSAVDSLGTPLAEINDDIDGDPRDATYPDIGADEFTATTVPPEALAGTYTVGDGGDFSSLSEVVNQMAYYGISAPVTINLAAGFYYEQLQLINISGTNDSTAITIQSLSGNPEDVTLYYAATSTSTNYVILLSDVDHVRFQNLTIMSDTTEGASYGRVFQFEGELDDVQIVNNVLIGSPGQGYQTDIIYSSSSLYSNNLIVNGNTFNYGDYGISVSSFWIILSLGTEITNNKFYNNKGISLSNHDAPGCRHSRENISPVSKNF